MSALRILHVTPYCGEAWAYGGIARLAATVARGLAARGHRVTVCTTDALDATSRLPRETGQGPGWRPFTTHTRDGVVVHVFPNVSNRLAYHLQAFAPLRMSRFMRARAASFDVAHLHACRNLPGAIAYDHLRRAGVPYVLAPNGTAPLIERRVLAKRAFDAWRGRSMLTHAARVLAVSRAEQQQLERAGVERRAISLVPNPLDLGEFDGTIPRGAFRARHALGQRPVVMFLGKLTPRKRVDLLAAAFARLDRRDARLVVAGNDMGDRRRIERCVHELGIADRTLFTGLLHGRERLEALADADVVVYPCEHEIFGLVPLEALLAGTPVVVTDDSGCGEIVRDLRGGQVVPSGDVAAIAGAVACALRAPERWRDEAADGAMVIRSRFAADAVCRQLEDVYGECAA